MSDTPAIPAEFLHATAELVIAGRPLRLEMPVPAGPVRLSELLPLFQSLTDSFVAFSAENARGDGLQVSCRKACGACCRQLVPVSGIEARQLRDRVEAMPEPRRTIILGRFAEALRRLQRAGLLESLRNATRLRDEEVIPFGIDYFHQRIACPFLEDESCSIHPERPLACREYLVVTPAEHCAEPTVDSVRGVSLVVHTARTIRALDAECSVQTPRWVPMTLALEWADAHPDETPPRPGPEWVREVFSRLTGHDIPAATP